MKTTTNAAATAANVALMGYAVGAIPGNLVQIGVAAVIVLLVVGQLQKIVNKML